MLEIIVVVAIIGIVSAMTFPNIQEWLAKRRLQADYQTLVAKMQYLRLKARTLPGSSRLQCTGNQVSATVNDANNALLESDPPAGSPASSLLHHPAQVLLTPCSASSISFASDGSTSGTREFFLHHSGDPAGARYGAYRLTLSGSTGFIRTYRLSPGASQWLETE